MRVWLFQSRGRDLLIGKDRDASGGGALVGVSVPWSGFINRKVFDMLVRLWFV